MFDAQALIRPEPAAATAEAMQAGTARGRAYATYMVRRNGEPFAILNATPANARRTLAGFARGAPGVSWSLEPHHG